MEAVTGYPLRDIPIREFEWEMDYRMPLFHISEPMFDRRPFIYLPIDYTCKSLRYQVIGRFTIRDRKVTGEIGDVEMWIYARHDWDRFAANRMGLSIAADKAMIEWYTDQVRR